MLVRDVMVNPVAVCSPDANLAEVAAILWDARCGTVPVVDAQGRVISVITDRDIAIALGTRNLRASDVLVKDVAPPRVFTCGPEDDFEDALNTMVTQNVRRLPVVEDGKLAGILSIDDLARSASQWPDDEDIPESDVIIAMRKIILARTRGRLARPAELIAMRA